MSKTLKVVVGVAALLVIAVAASLYWGQHKKVEFRSDIAALLTEASAQLRAALGVESDQNAADTPEAVSRLEQIAARLDQQVSALHAMDTTRNLPLAEAAEDYLTTARQIAVYQARMHRLRSEVAADARALAEHMRSADRRARGWIGEAMQKKDLLEKNYFDYRQASDAFADLTSSYITTRKTLVPLIGGGTALLEESVVREAYERARTAAKQAAAEVDQARQLAVAR